MMEQATHDDIMQALARGSERFDAMERSINAIAQQTSAIPQMQTDLAETRELVEAWDTVKNAGRFIKWFSGIVVALAALAVAIKTGIAHVLR